MLVPSAHDPCFLVERRLVVWSSTAVMAWVPFPSVPKCTSLAVVPAKQVALSHNPFVPALVDPVVVDYHSRFIVSSWLCLWLLLAGLCIHKRDRASHGRCAKATNQVPRAATDLFKLPIRDVPATACRPIEPPTATVASATTDAVVVHCDTNIPPRVFGSHLLVGGPLVLHRRAPMLVGCCRLPVHLIRLIRLTFSSTSLQVTFGMMVGGRPLVVHVTLQVRSHRRPRLCLPAGSAVVLGGRPGLHLPLDLVQLLCYVVHAFRPRAFGGPPLAMLRRPLRRESLPRTMAWLPPAAPPAVCVGNADDGNFADADELLPDPPGEPEPEPPQQRLIVGRRRQPARKCNLRRPAGPPAPPHPEEPMQQNTEPVRPARVVQRRRRRPARKCKQRPSQVPTRVQPHRTCKTKSPALQPLAGKPSSARRRSLRP